MLHAKWERRQIIGCFSILAENQGYETVMDRDEVYASCFHFAVTAGRTEGLGFEERQTVYVKRKPCSVRHLRMGMTPGSHAQGAWNLQG